MNNFNVGKFIKDRIEEQYETSVNFCNKNNIGYTKFVNKINGIKRGKDFRFKSINNILEILGYEFQIVKKNDKE